MSCQKGIIFDNMKQCIILILLACLTLSCKSTKTLSNKNEFQFDTAAVKMIMEGNSSDPMRVYKINNFQDSVLLRTQSKPVIVDSSDIILKTCIDRIYATVRDSISMGVGIAAPQVGILKNIIWVQRFDKDDFPFEYYLNPRIIQYTDKKQDCQEGCLSIPDRSDLTKNRAYAILIEYDTFENKGKQEMIEGFTAVIFQHEIDHLNGILYLDHLENEVDDSKD